MARKKKATKQAKNRAKKKRKAPGEFAELEAGDIITVKFNLKAFEFSDTGKLKGASTCWSCESDIGLSLNLLLNGGKVLVDRVRDNGTKIDIVEKSGSARRVRQEWVKSFKRQKRPPMAKLSGGRKLAVVVEGGNAERIGVWERGGAAYPCSYSMTQGDAKLVRNFLGSVLQKRGYKAFGVPEKEEEEKAKRELGKTSFSKLIPGDIVTITSAKAADDVVGEDGLLTCGNSMVAFALVGTAEATVAWRDGKLIVFHAKLNGDDGTGLEAGRSSLRLRASDIKRGTIEVTGVDESYIENHKDEPKPPHEAVKLKSVYHRITWDGGKKVTVGCQSFSEADCESAYEFLHKVIKGWDKQKAAEPKKKPATKKAKKRK